LSVFSAPGTGQHPPQIGPFSTGFSLRKRRRANLFDKNSSETKLLFRCQEIGLSDEFRQYIVLHDSQSLQIVRSSSGPPLACKQCARACSKPKVNIIAGRGHVVSHQRLSSRYSINVGAFFSLCATASLPRTSSISKRPGPTDVPETVVRAALIRTPAATPCSSAYDRKASSMDS